MNKLGLGFSSHRQICVIHMNCMPVKILAQSFYNGHMHPDRTPYLGRGQRPFYFIKIFCYVSLPVKPSSNSDISAPHASSCSGVLVGAKRGVTAYKFRPRPCHFSIRDLVSSYPDSAVSITVKGAFRSIRTLPAIMRELRDVASSKNASARTHDEQCSTQPLS